MDHKFIGLNFQNPSLKNIKEHHQEQYYERFVQAVRRWNQLVRNYMSHAMGISLSDGESVRHQISILIQSAPNESFFQLIKLNYPDSNFEAFRNLSLNFYQED